MMKRKIAYIYLILMMVAAACAPRPKDAVEVDELPPIYPDYVDVTIPADIAPLNFNVIGDDVTDVYVDVKGSKGGALIGKGKWANFDIKAWRELTEANAGGKLNFTVYAKTAGKWLKYRDFTVDVSQYLLDEWGVTYRRIAPGYEVYSKMGLYQRDLSSFDEFPIIENTQTSGQCYNCHTSNRTNPDQFVFHVRGAHGATMISQDGECTWLKAINDTIGGSLVYPYWHPSGRYCAFSTNQTRQGFHIAGDKRLEVFDLSSDVLVYDIEKNEIILDSLITTSNWSENAPSFSPDGKSVYFTTCLQKEYPLEYTDEQYNLCRIEFDPETGRFGEKVDTLFNAVEKGKSVSWVRPSYNGKYVLFTLSDYGYFSIWHPESEQWMLNLDNGEAYPLDNANSDNADSYHNWNLNSHWIVFTSRRDDGLYTRLYLCEIDDEGRASKPFLLPQYNPQEYYDASLYSYNTPDFTQRRVDFDSHAASKAIISDERIPTQTRRQSTKAPQPPKGGAAELMPQS